MLINPLRSIWLVCTMHVVLIMFLCTACLYKARGVNGTHPMSLVRARRVTRYEILSRGEPQCCLDNNFRERERC